MIAREVKHVWFVCLCCCLATCNDSLCVELHRHHVCILYFSHSLSLSYVLECLMIFVLLLLCDDKTDLNQEQLLNNTR